MKGRSRKVFKLTKSYDWLRGFGRGGLFSRKVFKLTKSYDTVRGS